MDTITHGALGIVAGWLRRTDQRLSGPRRSDPETDRAVPWATFMAAEAPDLDVYIRRIDGLEWVSHRGITHTVVAVPVIALLVALVCKLIFRGARFRVLYLWSAGSVLICHLMADVITWTGIRPFLPWSNWRLNLELMPFIDLLFSLPLLLVVVLGWRRPAWRRNLAVAFAVAALLYLGGRAGAKAAMEPGAAAVVTGHRRVTVEADGYRIREAAFWAPWRVKDRRLPPSMENAPAVAAARAVFSPISRYTRPVMPYYRVEQRGGVRRVTQIDLLARFPLGHPWAEVDANGVVVRQGRTWFAGQ